MPEIQNSNIAAALTALLKLDPTVNRLREGDVFEVSLLKKAQREVFFDMGKFGTGIVYGVELGNAREIIKGLEIGQKLPAKIVDLDGRDGYAELSLAEAGKQRLWQQAQDLMESGEIVKFKVAGANTGGLVGSLFDLKAFLPTSQLSNDHQPKEAGENDRMKQAEELKRLVGEELSVKVINVNARTSKLIVSERETLNTNVKELLAQYQVGQDVDGLVSGLADFGIFVRFVDNPQIEGLVHISEIDHRIVDNPKELMKLNEPVRVKVIDIKDGRVFLSLKALRENPWEKAADHFKAGDVVSGTVYKFNPFGATIDLPHGLQGMIHISEFGSVDEMKKAIEQGKIYSFVVDSLRPEEKRCGLKMSSGGGSASGGKK